MIDLFSTDALTSIVDSAESFGGYLLLAFLSHAPDATQNVLTGFEKKAGERLFELITKTRDMSEQSGSGLKGFDDFNRIPLAAGVDLVQKAILETDEELKERWAALLYSFLDDPGKYARVAFVSILHNLTSTDAVIMRRIYAIQMPDAEQRYATPVMTAGLPISASIVDHEAKGESSPSPDVQISLENLERLNLLRSGMMWSGPSYVQIYQTRTGMEFAKAVFPREVGSFS